MIRVYIVDDHSLIREGIKRILLETGDMEVCGEAGDGIKLISDLSSPGISVDVLLLDISLPGRDGLSLIKEVKNIFPSVRILMLSIMPEGEFALRALKSGASGYIKKENTPDDLVNAIRKVFQGGKYISDSVAAQLIDQVSGTRTPIPHEALSDREFQVFLLIAQGKTVSEIARKLSLSVKTISNFRSRLMKKLGLANNSQLIRYAFDNGLV